MAQCPAPFRHPRGALLRMLGSAQRFSWVSGIPCEQADLRKRRYMLVEMSVIFVSAARDFCFGVFSVNPVGSYEAQEQD